MIPTRPHEFRAPAALAADLPRPPALVHWTLEQPLPLAAGLLVLGIVCLVVLNQRAELRRGILILAACLAGSLSLLLGGWLIETEREALAARTRTLVERVFDRDVSVVRLMLGENLVLTSGGDLTRDRNAETNDRRDVLAMINGLPPMEWDQRIRAATIDAPGQARTEVTVRVKGALTSDGLVPSTWQLTWRKEPDGRWTVRRIDCVSIMGRAPGAEWVRRARQFRTITQD